MRRNFYRATGQGACSTSRRCCHSCFTRPHRSCSECITRKRDHCGSLHCSHYGVLVACGSGETGDRYHLGLSQGLSRCAQCVARVLGQTKCYPWARFDSCCCGLPYPEQTPRRSFYHHRTPGRLPAGKSRASCRSRPIVAMACTNVTQTCSLHGRR